MHKGTSIIDVSSMLGHILPSLIIPKKIYKYNRINKDFFLKKLMNHLAVLSKIFCSELAYAISKNFVIWFAKTDAVKFGEKGVRV